VVRHILETWYVGPHAHSLHLAALLSCLQSADLPLPLPPPLPPPPLPVASVGLL